METHTREVEEWEKEFENLAAINYNLYLAGTVQRADTGEDWTFEQAERELKNFIHHQLQKARQDGYNAGLADGTDKPLLAIEQMLQKARQDWLREEIVKLEGILANKQYVDISPFDHAEVVRAEALQTIIERYHSELDQDNK